MIINVGGLNQGRAVARSQENPKALACFEADELEFIKPIDVYVEMTKMGFDVYLDCTFATTVNIPCCRCLERYPLDLRVRYRMLFVPAQDGVEGRAAEDGVYLYHESTIDLADYICEAIRTELPRKPLCKPDCRGLCSHCGKNLNEGPCTCRDSDDSFHPFKDLKLR
ncbi:MAG TPA: DUF177 domain-containing protein [Planctomycetota bacterium]|nr:DUF177 domain-containing protein [Planctomycetota bacterium]